MVRKTILRSGSGLALLGILAAALVLGGCSCKEYEEQILQMDQQIADLQQQMAEKENRVAECNQMVDELRANLKKAEQDKQVLVQRLEEEVVIQIQQELLFAPGSDMVLDTMVPTLKTIAQTINEHPDWMVYVQGHTDGRRLIEDLQYKWPSNWELAAARACAVVRYMTNFLDLPPERFACVSYGPFKKVADDSTPEGRKANRRVEFLLHKMDHQRGKPVD